MKKYLFFITIILSACAEKYPYSRAIEVNDSIKNGMTIDARWVNPGDSKTIEFVGYPVTVYKRTKDDLLWLNSSDNLDEIVDPKDHRMDEAINNQKKSIISIVWAKLFNDGYQKFKTEPHRSFDKDFFVFFNFSPINGCALRPQKEMRKNTYIMVFYDICSKTSYDSAGRALIENDNEPNKTKNIKKYYNLFVPPYIVENEKIIIESSGINKIEPPKFLSTGKSPEEMMEHGIKFNDINLVKEAIENGFDLKKPSYPPNYFLNSAISNSGEDIVKFLLANGAKTDEMSMIIIKSAKREDLEFIKK